MDINFLKVLNEALDADANNLNDNFWNWFGSSKVKAGNEPIMCYHGSRAYFEVFVPSTSVGNQGEDDQIEGIYFTDNKDGASFFASSDDDRYLKKVFLSIKKPYVVESHNVLKDELGIDLLADANKRLKQMGYDGIIMDRGFYAMGGPHRLFLAFYPNQVKSINNDGSWDVNDDNILS